MGRREGTQSARVIRKRQTPHVIIKDNRDAGQYVKGIYVREKEERSTVLLYSQPLNKNLDQTEVGERSTQRRNGWATIDQSINLRDRIEINDGIFTVQNIQEWDYFRSFDLIRTGEKQNIAEGEESAIL
jgi:hypothetical protein